jgi:hypothetical protein
MKKSLIVVLTVLMSFAVLRALPPNVDPYQRTQFGSPGSSNNPIYQAYGNPVTWAAGAINSNIIEVAGNSISAAYPLPVSNAANTTALNPSGTPVAILNVAVIGGPNNGIPVQITSVASGVTMTVIDEAHQKIHVGQAFCFQDITITAVATGKLYCFHPGTDSGGIDINFNVNSYAEAKWYLYETTLNSFVPGINPLTLTVNNVNRTSGNTTTFMAYANYVTGTTGTLIDSCFTSKNVPGYLGFIQGSTWVESMLNTYSAYYIKVLPDANGDTISLRGFYYIH